MRKDAGADGDEFAGVEEIRFAGEIPDQTPGLGNQQRPRGHVPGFESTFKKSVIAARRDVGQIDRRRAWPPQAHAALRHLLEHLQVGVDIVVLAERKARADQCIFNLGAARDAKAPVVEKSTAAAAGCEELVA